MATVELRFPPEPSHVRTARLVGVAAARRAGLPDALVDELRLALGEACSRAVVLHGRYAPGTPVLVAVRDEDGRLTVEVTDLGPPPATFDGGLPDLLHEASTDPDVALAFVAGLVEDVEVRRAGDSTVVTLRWPVLASVH